LLHLQAHRVGAASPLNTARATNRRSFPFPRDALMMGVSHPHAERRAMVLCPVALAVGCRKCPIFSVCPAKSIIGDYKPDPDATRSPAVKPAPRKGKAAKKR